MRPLALPLLLAASSLSGSLAQRPSTASTCDYYAQQLYGANNSDTQFKLIQHLVVLAFGGGSNLANASNVPGILNPGVFDSEAIDLRPFFNGSKASTNLNNQGVGVDWLDDGAITPLKNFRTGSTSPLALDQTSNQ